MSKHFFSLSDYYQGPKTDHFNGKAFYNPWQPRRHSWASFIQWKAVSKPQVWPRFVNDHSFDIPPPYVEGDALRVSFVGHTTVLIQTQRLNILTDPVWAEKLSPLKWPQIKRITRPGISLSHLPKIDLILVSHNHYDHLDLNCVQALWKKNKPLIITPIGNDTVIGTFDKSIGVKTLDWNEHIEVENNIKIHLQPSQHWSGRGLWDIDKALWGSFVIETNGGNIYFAGDTGYSSSLFQNIKRKFQSFRFALLPIGVYEPRWFMQYSHMNPQDAVLAYQDLGEPYTMGTHFGTFRLSDEGYKDPIADLENIKSQYSIPKGKFRALNIGESWTVP